MQQPAASELRIAWRLKKKQRGGKSSLGTGNLAGRPTVWQKPKRKKQLWAWAVAPATSSGCRKSLVSAKKHLNVWTVLGGSLPNTCQSCRPWHFCSRAVLLHDAVMSHIYLSQRRCCDSESILISLVISLRQIHHDISIKALLCYMNTHRSVCCFLFTGLTPFNSKPSVNTHRCHLCSAVWTRCLRYLIITMTSRGGSACSVVRSVLLRLYYM